MCQLVDEGKSYWQVAKLYGVSVSNVHRWHKRWREAGRRFSSLYNHPPTQRRTRARRDIEGDLGELFKQGLRGIRLHRALLKRGHRLSVSTMYRALHRLKLVRKRSRKPRLEPAKATYSFGYVQCDCLELAPEVIQYTAIECHTRLRFIRLYPGVSIANSVDFLSRALRFFPFLTHTWSTDGGSEFTHEANRLTDKRTLFTLALEHAGKRHRVYIGQPNKNGRVERSHRSDREEFYNLYPLSEAIGKVPEWLRYWNEGREHMALGWKTPKAVLEELLGTPVSLRYDLCE
jgi:transposase